MIHSDLTVEYSTSKNQISFFLHVAIQLYKHHLLNLLHCRWTLPYEPPGKPKYKKTSPYCTLLYCDWQIMYFYHLKSCGKSVLSKPIIAISFKTACVYFMSLCHILIFITIFQMFLLLLHLLWLSVLSDFWCYFGMVLGSQTIPT